MTDRTRQLLPRTQQQRTDSGDPSSDALSDGSRPRTHQPEARPPRGMLVVSIHPSRLHLPKPGENIAQICARAVTGWLPRWVEPEILAHFLDDGISIAPVFTDGHARNDSFAETWLIALDCDEPGEFESVCANSWIKQFARIEGETKSSAPDALCGRVFLQLDEPLTTVAAVKDFTDRVLYRLEQDGITLHDKGVRDAFRPYFGFKTGTTRLQDGDRLTSTVLSSLPVRPTVSVETRRELPVRGSSTSSGDILDAWAEWIAHEVIPHLDSVSPVIRQRGQYRRCPNPHHTDENPSFRISYQKHAEGYPVCSCNLHHERDAWGKVAMWVGARDFKTWLREERASFAHNTVGTVRFANPEPSAPASSPVAPALAHVAVPDSWRMALLRTVGEAAAALYEHLTQAIALDLLNAQTFTLAEVRASLDQLDRADLLKDINRPLRTLSEYGFICRMRNRIDPSDSVSPFANKSGRRGAPEIQYSFAPLKDQQALLLEHEKAAIHQKVYVLSTCDGTPAPLARIDDTFIRTLLPALPDAEIAQIAQDAEIASDYFYQQPAQRAARARAHVKEVRWMSAVTYELQASRSSSLEEDWFARGHYRLAVLRALYHHRRDEFFNKGQSRLAWAIGVSVQRVGGMLDKAGIRRIQASPSESTVAVKAQPQTVVKEVQQVAQERHAKPLYVRMISASGRTEISAYNAESAMQLASTAAAKLGQLEVIFQLPNRHELATDVQPPQSVEKRPLVTLDVPLIAADPPSTSTMGQERPAKPIAGRADMVGESADESVHPARRVRYRLEWAVGQLTLRFICRDDRYISPIDGTFARLSASPRELLELLIGRSIAVDFIAI